MATTTEELRTVLTVDGAQASQELRRYSLDIGRVGDESEKTSRRSTRSNDSILESNRRVRRELGGLAQDLVNIKDPAQIATSAVLRLSETFRIGLGAGVAATVGVVLVDQILKARDAFLALDKEVRESILFKGGGAFRTSGAIDSNIDNLKKELDKVQEARYPTKPGDIVQKYIASGFVSGGIDQVNADLDQKKKDIQEAIGRDLDAQVTKQEKLTQISHEALDGSQKEAALLKAKVDYQEKLGTLQERYSGVQGHDEEKAKLEDALTSQFKDQVTAIQEKARFSELEQESQHRVLDLQRSGLSVAVQAIDALKEKEQLLSQQLETSQALTNEERSRLQNEREGVHNQRLKAQFDESETSLDQRAAEKNQQNKFVNFIRGQTPSNPNATLTSPDAYDQRNILGERITNPTTGRIETRQTVTDRATERFKAAFEEGAHPLKDALDAGSKKFEDSFEKGTKDFEKQFNKSTLQSADDQQTAQDNQAAEDTSAQIAGDVAAIRSFCSNLAAA